MPAAKRKRSSKTDRRDDDGVVEDESISKTNESTPRGNGSGKKPTGATENTTSSYSESFTVPSPPASKSIQCIRSGPSSSNAPSDKQPLLIFTHGAGGTLQAPAVVNFTSGYSETHPMVAFQGSMNLKSRKEMFHDVVEYELGREERRFVFGGRSMGARAAVMAASASESISDGNEVPARISVSTLVLISYPLVSPKGEVRDAILLDLPDTVKVLFVIGEKDSMCPLQQLEKVRREMKCRSWLVVVGGAGHGMDVSPGGKKVTEMVGVAVGRLVARWIGRNHGDGKIEVEDGKVWWNEDEGKVESSWGERNDSQVVADGIEKENGVHDIHSNKKKAGNKAEVKHEKKGTKEDGKGGTEKSSTQPASRPKRTKTKHSAALKGNADLESPARSTRRSTRLRS